MSERESVLELITECYAVNGVGTPIEEIVRLCSQSGMDVSNVREQIIHLRRKGMVYQMKPGMIVPVKRGKRGTNGQ